MGTNYRPERPERRCLPLGVITGTAVVSQREKTSTTEESEAKNWPLLQQIPSAGSPSASANLLYAVHSIGRGQKVLLSHLENSALFLLANQPASSDVCSFTSGFCGPFPLASPTCCRQREALSGIPASLTAKGAAGPASDTEQDTANIVTRCNCTTKLFCC